MIWFSLILFLCAQFVFWDMRRGDAHKHAEQFRQTLHHINCTHIELARAQEKVFGELRDAVRKAAGLDATDLFAANTLASAPKGIEPGDRHQILISAGDAPVAIGELLAVHAYVADEQGRVTDRVAAVALVELRVGTIPVCRFSTVGRDNGVTSEITREFIRLDIRPWNSMMNQHLVITVINMSDERVHVFCAVRGRAEFDPYAPPFRQPKRFF